MSGLINILAARGDDGGLEKFIGFVVVALIVGINAIIGAIKKRQEQKHREEVRQQIKRTPRPQETPPVQPMRVIVPPPVPQQRLQIRQRAQRAAKKRQQQQPAPPPPPVPVEVEAPRANSPETAPTVSPTAGKRVAVNAAAIANWMRPATLQKQFILTEILQPPVALREPRY